METEQPFFITWFESDKAELIEDILDDRNIPIDMVPTPANIRDQEDYVMVCKDAFQVRMEVNRAFVLGSFDFPKETRCFDEWGVLFWVK
ncbi:hypothetical protein JOD82_002037 [Paenibacillus sp. 1182]|uniref:hypothetical protein n=1 Tax=Paenibacillus sp. 1182 TaxID=2806565 RepID=UPI001AE43360|nr:hypothetical protein [Paenibacillus sp. 1182]MBP1309017.1 hypothetical protein [Paenibacillus sp. 1182]